MIHTLIFNGVTLRLVPHEPDKGYRLYVSHDGKIGLRIAPGGVETLLNARPTTTENCKNSTNAKRKQRYLTFHDVWGHHQDILVSHAVYLAWVGPIDKPCIDHKNGITTDNRYPNLEPVTYRENARRTTILQGLRQVGIDPAQLPFPVLDKYLDPKNQCDPNEQMEREMRQHREN